jgi:hypothetical protein
MAKQEKHRTSTIYIRGISTEKKNHFKAHCAKRNKSMKKVIEEFMDKCCDRDKSKAAIA